MLTNILKLLGQPLPDVRPSVPRSVMATSSRPGRPIENLAVELLTPVTPDPIQHRSERSRSAGGNLGPGPPGRGARTDKTWPPDKGSAPQLCETVHPVSV